ncbi:MAG: alpha/beta fold hydrolase [Actinomycetota bacterium]
MSEVFQGISQKAVVAGNITWRVASTGPEDGPAILLVHGFPEHWRTWTLQMPALAGAGFRVHACDLPGYGGTSAPSGYDIPTVAAGMADLARELSPDGVHLVGHDWGAIVANGVAYFHPETVRSIVAACGPHPGSFGTGKRHPQQLMKSWYVMLFQVPYIEQLLGFRTLIERALPDAVVGIDTREEMARALSYYRTNFAPWGPAQEKIGSIKQPALVIHAQKDIAITDAIMDVTAEKFEDLRDYIKMPNGHFLQRDGTEEFNRHLVAFLKSV